jgi:PhnB protein
MPAERRKPCARIPGSVNRASRALLQCCNAPQAEDKTMTDGIALGGRSEQASARRPQPEGTPAMAGVKSIPDGYPRLSPYLIVDGAARAIAFYTAVFGARERMRLDAREGKIGHAELEIGDSLVMLADEFPPMDAFGPAKFGGSPIGLHLYVADVDAVAREAVAGGAKLVRPLRNEFYGDRTCTIEDPFGHRWNVSTHVEDVSNDEIARRAAEWARGEGA